MSVRTVHPIEVESFRILRSRVDPNRWTTMGPHSRDVTERVIHASADLAYLDDLVVSGEDDLAAAAHALRAGRPVVADVEMVAAGITRRDLAPVVCAVTDPRAAGLAATSGLTRSAAAVDVALDTVGPGAVWVIGCAPTALFRLLDRADDVRPALVVGLPVGFVGAAESKAALRMSGLPAVSNVGEKGGSAVAAAAVNALLYGGHP